MKLLLDTNVLVAALIARGTCSDLLEHCVRQHVVISSQPLLIITGDQDLLGLDPFRGIHILSPSAFWRWESEGNKRSAREIR